MLISWHRSKCRQRLSFFSHLSSLSRFVCHLLVIGIQAIEEGNVPYNRHNKNIKLIRSDDHHTNHSNMQFNTIVYTYIQEKTNKQRNIVYILLLENNISTNARKKKIKKKKKKKRIPRFLPQALILVLLLNKLKQKYI
jgi:uncharacterized protein YjaZ